MNVANVLWRNKNTYPYYRINFLRQKVLINSRIYYFDQSYDERKKDLARIELVLKHLEFSHLNTTHRQFTVFPEKTPSHR